MAAETNLSVLLRSMAPRLEDEAYVFATMAEGSALPEGIRPLMIFHEREGTTLILPQADAERLSAPGATSRTDTPGLITAYPCRLITLTVHSSLDAVGFLAAISARLAAAGISVNAVSAFHHDHLFVPADRAADAVALLRVLSGR